MTIFPAAPGTIMVVYDLASKELKFLPVIAWQHVQGNIAFPVTVVPHNGLSLTSAIVHPDKKVCSPSMGRSFDSPKHWLDALVDKLIEDREGQKPSAAPTPLDGDFADLV